jgi:hypothetical protein
MRPRRTRLLLPPPSEGQYIHGARDCRQRMMRITHVSISLPLYRAYSNLAIHLALHAKRSIVDDIPPSRTAPSSGLGFPFSMQTPSRGPANPLPSSDPVSAFDGRRPQLPRVNADTQRAKPRQTSLTTAFGLSANISASKASGSNAPSPGTWEHSTPLDSVSVGASSSKISTKPSMPNLSAPQSHRSHPSAASKLKRTVSFTGNLHAPGQGKRSATLGTYNAKYLFSIFLFPSTDTAQRVAAIFFVSTASQCINQVEKSVFTSSAKVEEEGCLENSKVHLAVLEDEVKIIRGR